MSFWSNELHSQVKEMAWYVGRDDRVIFIATFGRILREVRTGVSDGPYVSTIDDLMNYCTHKTRANVPLGMRSLIEKEVANG